MTYTIRECEKKEIPRELYEIPEPPERLYIAGCFPSQENIALCVVGSRQASAYGKDVCKKLIGGLAGYPVTIVSGLALGIDSLAHREALQAGLTTVAFPGSGLSREVLYPRTNLKLAEAIITNGGALISEFENTFSATPWSFPKRNRLMAGFSKATLVIEANERSGTLITARLALDYNRDVFAVPHGIFSPNAHGVNRLIQQGATPIISPEDILHALNIPEKNLDENNASREAILTSREKILWNMVTESVPRDDLIRISELPAHETSEILMLLELKGFVKEEMGVVRRIL